MSQPLAAGGNFLLPDWTFVAELIAFLVILGVLARYVLPPIQRVMRERQEMLAKQAEDADNARAKLAQTEEDYKKALNEARLEAAQIRENARAEAQRTIEELRAEAREEYARIVARGDEQLAAQRSAIVRELRGELGDLAVELSERIIDQRLADDANVQATVESFLAELESREDAGSGASST